jgi:signal transduction histidine kinase
MYIIMSSLIDKSNSIIDFSASQLLKDFDWVELFSMGIFVTNQSWKLIQWNHEFLRTLNLKDDFDIKEQDVFLLMGLPDYHLEISINQVRMLTFTLPGTDTALDLRTTCMMKDGESFGIGLVSHHSPVIQDKDWCNHFQYHLLLNQQTHLLEKRLEGLIHNINTPLNTIIGYVQILLRENPESKALQKIMESGFQIDASLKSIHDKIEASRTRFPQYVDVNKVIRNELEISRNNLFFKHNVNVELALEEKLPLLNIVYGDLSYCLDAVLWNAIESLHVKENKMIYIETKMQNDWLRIIIRDTGSGILPKDMPYLYEYGFSTKKSDNAQHLGLGLSFTRQVIHDYLGKISINSEYKIGTTVTIDLPVEEMS